MKQPYFLPFQVHVSRGAQRGPWPGGAWAQRCAEGGRGGGREPQETGAGWMWPPLYGGEGGVEDEGAGGGVWVLSECVLFAF